MLIKKNNRKGKWEGKTIPKWPLLYSSGKLLVIAAALRGRQKESFEVLNISLSSFFCMWVDIFANCYLHASFLIKEKDGDKQAGTWSGIVIQCSCFRNTSYLLYLSPRAWFCCFLYRLDLFQATLQTLSQHLQQEQLVLLADIKDNLKHGGRFPSPLLTGLNERPPRKNFLPIFFFPCTPSKEFSVGSDGLCLHVAKERLILWAHSACRQSAGHNSSSLSCNANQSTLWHKLQCLAQQILRWTKHHLSGQTLHLTSCLLSIYLLAKPRFNKI